MRIREGDPLEIYTASDGEVIFKKYSPIGELSPLAVQFAEALAKHTPFSVLVCDRDHCIAAAGISKKEVLERRVAPRLEEIMESRRSFVLQDPQSRHSALEGVERHIAVAAPIISAGDITGAVVLLCNEAAALPGETDCKLTQVAANFLAKQMEE